MVDPDDIGDFGSYGRPVNSNSDWHSKTALMAGNTEGGWNNGWGDFGSHRYGPAAGWGVNFDNERRSKTDSKNPKGKELSFRASPRLRMLFQRGNDVTCSVFYCRSYGNIG